MAVSLPEPYWRDERRNLTIYHGDCRDILPCFANGEASVILTDPQYFLPPAGHNAKGDAEWCGSLGDLALLEEGYKWFFAETKRLLGRRGQMYLCCHDRSYPVFYRLAYTRWPRVQMIVWYKPTGRVGNGWRRSYELVLHAAGKDSEYVEGFRLDLVGIMPVRTMQRGHPAEKPGELGDFLLEAVPAGGLVVDPFMGSGTFIESAARNGFQAVGIELEERYCEMAAARLSEDLTYGEPNLFSGRVPAEEERDDL